MSPRTTTLTVCAAKGSAKAFDVVSEAESAFMVAVARDARAIDWDLTRVLPLYAKQIGSAPTVQRLLDVAAEHAWVGERLQADGSRVRTHRGLWGAAPASRAALLLGNGPRGGHEFCRALAADYR